MGKVAEAIAAETFLKTVGAAEAQSFKAVGLGQDLRFQDTNVSGAALVADDRSGPNSVGFRRLRIPR